MRDDFDALIAERFAVLVDVPVPDTRSLVQSKLLDSTAAPFTEEETNVIDLEVPTRAREHHRARTLIVALVGVAAAATLIGALVIVNGGGDPDQSPPVDSSPATVPSTTVHTAPAPTTVYTPPATEFLDMAEDQIAVLRELVEAINAGDADAFLGVVDPEGGFDLQGGFAENADVLFGHLIQHFDEEPLVRAWMSIVNAWGLEVQLTSCRPRVAADDNGFLFMNVEGEDGFLLCEVRTLWHTLSLELTEEWQINLRSGKVTWFGQWSAPRLRDLNPQPRQLALGYDGLEAWEAWLEQTDPDAAARYLIPRAAPQPCDAESGCLELNLAPGDPELAYRIWNLSQPAENALFVNGLQFLPINAIPYDPQWADEVKASIQDYVAEFGTPAALGEEISVTPDLVEFGDHLVGLISNMDRADGRTYVIAGRYETETDLFFPPEEAVLAAFDDAGRELWRTELGETPTTLVADSRDVWVLHKRTGTLSRIDASDGRFIDRVSVGAAPSLFALFVAFESTWVYIPSVIEGEPGRLIRVRPDMSTSTIEVPASIVNLDDVPSLDPAVGAGEIWIPLGGAGVAVVDVETGRVTVIAVDGIGGEVRRFAIHDGVAYVAGRNRVTSVVDGQVGTILSFGEIGYLGLVEGVFGAWSSQGFVVLSADDPMNAEVRQIRGEMWGVREIDGEAWREEGRHYNLRRVTFITGSAGGG